MFRFIASPENITVDEGTVLDMLTGFVTQNKCVTSGNNLGQLLDSMEKLPGDMAVSWFRTSGPFAVINIYRLLVNYTKKFTTELKN